MRQKRILSGLLVGILMAGVLAACAPATQTPAPATPAETAAPGTTATAPGATTAAPALSENGASGSVEIALMTETPSLAPARHNHQIAILKNFMTHERLFEQHYDTLEPTPLLVKEWTAISDVLFEFTLHEGITFSNGEPLTAEDVVASWHWVRETPDARGVHISAQDAEVVDTYTFRIYTGVPDAGLFYDLTSHGNSIVPKSLIDAGNDFNVNPVGSGTYIFEEWRSGDFLTFTANPNYWNPERAAHIDHVTWSIIPEGASRTIAYEMGEIDFIFDVPLPDVARLEADPGTTVFMRTSPALNFLQLNHERPQFQNPYVRQALMMTINQEEIVEGALDGFGFVQRAQLPVVFAGTSHDDIFPYDPEGARALLAEHGIDPATVGFEIIVTTEAGRRAAEIIQAQVLDIGIPVTINMMDSTAGFAAGTAGDFEAQFGSWNAAWIISFLRNHFLYTDDILNRNFMRNEEISELILQGIATIDPAARAAVFEQATRAANEYVAWIPSHLAMNIRAFDANLVAPELSGMTTILNINSWHWAN